MKRIVPLGLMVGGGVLIALFLPAVVIVSMASLACGGSPFASFLLASVPVSCVPFPFLWLLFLGAGVSLAAVGALLLRSR